MIITDDFALQFDGSKSIGLYQYKMDSSLNDNLILEEKTWRITPFWKKNDPQESMMVANYDLRIINKSSEVDEKEILESPNNIRTDLDSRINEFRRNLKFASFVRDWFWNKFNIWGAKRFKH